MGGEIATARVVEAAYEEGRARGMSEKRMEEEGKNIEGKAKAIEKPSLISKPRMVRMAEALRLPRFLRFLK